MGKVRLAVFGGLAHAVQVLGSKRRAPSRAGVQPHEDDGPSAGIGTRLPIPEFQCQHRLRHEISGGLGSPQEAVLAGRVGGIH